MNVVLTMGTFDLLHIGHLELLRESQALAGPWGSLVVGLNRDEFVERFKGARPAQSYEERFQMLRAIRGVTMVLPNFGDEHAGLLIDLVRPNIITIGSDWAGKDYLGQLHIDRKFVQDRGIQIKYIPRTTGQSTTALKQKIRKA